MSKSHQEPKEKHKFTTQSKGGVIAEISMYVIIKLFGCDKCVLPFARSCNNFKIDTKIKKIIVIEIKETNNLFPQNGQ